jgi:hypothetical protein
MLIWRGHGILIPLAAVIGLVGGWLVLGVLVALLRISIPALPVILGFWTSALCVWLYALTLGKPVEQLMVNPHTGQQFIQRYNRHTFFFIPAKYWAILSSLLAIVMSCLLPLVKLPDSKPVADLPGGAEFENANSLLTSARNGVAHGNTTEAKALAEKFSVLIKEYREAGIEQAKKKSSLSLTKGQFLTYCHILDDTCVFLVHVPDLRKFNSEAKEFMCTAAWHTANLVLADQKLPKRLAVGVRGAVLYEEFITGTAVGASEDAEEGIENRHDGLDKQVVYSYFVPQKSRTGTSALAKNVSDRKPAPSGSQKVAETPGAESQAQTSPPPPASPAASAPANPGAASPMASSSPPASAPAPVPAPPAAALLPTEVREWKSADGRPMKASLVRFNDAAGATARFRREDGQEFDLPVEKFSAGDQAELKRLHQASSAS